MIQPLRKWAFTLFGRPYLWPQSNGREPAAEHPAGGAESRGEGPYSRNPAGPASSASDLLAAAKTTAAHNRQMARDAAALGSTRVWPFH